jgi:hypothetical protein
MSVLSPVEDLPIGYFVVSKVEFWNNCLYRSKIKSDYKLVLPYRFFTAPLTISSFFRKVRRYVGELQFRHCLHVGEKLFLPYAAEKSFEAELSDIEKLVDDFLFFCVQDYDKLLEEFRRKMVNSFNTYVKKSGIYKNGLPISFAYTFANEMSTYFPLRDKIKDIVKLCIKKEKIFRNGDSFIVNGDENNGYTYNEKDFMSIAKCSFLTSLRSYCDHLLDNRYLFSDSHGHNMLLNFKGFLIKNIFELTEIADALGAVVFRISHTGNIEHDFEKRIVELRDKCKAVL